MYKCVCPCYDICGHTDTHRHTHCVHTHTHTHNLHILKASFYDTVAIQYSLTYNTTPI